MGQAPAGIREHPLLAGLARLRAGLAELSQANAWSLSDAELGQACEELTAAQAQLAAAELVLIGEADRRRLGATVGSSTAGWLRGRLLLHPGEAARAVVLAGALAGPLAATGAALAAGELSATHARVIAETMAALPPVGPGVAGRAEAFLIGQASLLDPVLLGRAGRALIETLTSTPDADSRIVAQQGRRHLHLTPAADGMIRLAGWLDAEAGATLTAALDPLAAPRPADDGTPDPRPAARRRADALLDLVSIAVAAGGLPDSGKTPATLTVTIDHQLLTGAIAGAGHTGDGTPISPATARRLGCDAQIIPALLGTAGQPLDIGRTTRTIPPAIRRALHLRDHGCAMPGCHTPPAWTDAHHITHWAAGGPTNLANLVLLCGAHHTAIHHNGWTVHIDTDGLPTFHAPPHICPASSSWQRFGSVKVGDLAVCEAPVDIEGPVPGERFVRADGVELDPVVLGVRGQGETVWDVLAVEPLVFQ